MRTRMMYKLHFKAMLETMDMAFLLLHPRKKRCTIAPVFSKSSPVFSNALDKLQKVQRGLTERYQNDNSLRDQVISACRGIPECSLALYQPAKTFEGVCAQLRSAVGTAVRTQESQSQQFYTETPTHHDDPNQYN